jgi:very-short-patch-repair endonuclease
LCVRCRNADIPRLTEQGFHTIEVDGATHGSDAWLCHDRRRTEYLGRQGWRVLRITNDDVYGRLEDIPDAIMRVVLQER